MQAFLFLALIPAVFCASILKPVHKCDQACILVYDPVCGTDGKTYSNSCFLSLAHCKDPSVSLAHKGPCNEGTTEDPCSKYVCPAIYDPVCGTDNKTYANSCYLRIAHCKDPSVSLAHKGPCYKRTSAVPCSERVCTFNYDPVCGTDNKTYGMLHYEPSSGNKCVLEIENCNTGVTVAHYGPCEDHFIFSYRMRK